MALEPTAEDIAGNINAQVKIYFSKTGLYTVGTMSGTNASSTGEDEQYKWFVFSTDYTSATFTLGYIPSGYKVQSVVADDGTSFSPSRYYSGYLVTIPIDATKASTYVTVTVIEKKVSIDIDGHVNIKGTLTKSNVPVATQDYVDTAIQQAITGAINASY